MSLSILLVDEKKDELVSKNITHNLANMWREAGVYDALYNSEGKTAEEVLPVMKEGLKRMAEDPERYEAFNSPNGWGLYKNAFPWLADLIAQFEEYPDGIIEVYK